MPVSPFNICVLVSGNGSNLQAIIDNIEQNRINARIACVISDKKDAYAIERARRHRITHEVLIPKNGEAREDYDQRLSDIIDRQQTDLIVLAGFMRILSTKFVNRYKGRMINIHPALLPKFKGLNTHQRAIDAGETRHGASVHFVTPELDGGPIIMQSEVPVLANDTKDILAARVLKREHILYPTVIGLIAAGKVAMNNGKILLDSRPIEEPLQLEHNE
ncbi:MAG: phosphoribosylglycinamide formyltransferase [Gammaproteobacteria bacterium]|nr:MAG: phosphoribosylglycinamide formyltransferase [Gammaproteobacteria bacterium]